ncbi:transmembrane protein 267 isoform X2 [Meleagris gallopavo]|uniref:transmembrane protein 267 isoform X2 n=1 Tax=Meleagris gallopavo TaxID=9103 RepID=UPI0012ABA1B3|nr:transmembrane protein 267 isoform X2 [Meleagris gallopavo]
MASETEKAHALLQTFSAASVISSLGLGIFCFAADRLLQVSFVQQNDWLRAFSDSAVHGILGMWSWAIVIGLRKKSDFTEVTMAGFLASVIDVDHFLLAGSLSLKATLSTSDGLENGNHIMEQRGCSESSPETTPSLFYCDSCCGSDIKAYYAPF